VSDTVACTALVQSPGRKKPAGASASEAHAIIPHVRRLVTVSFDAGTAPRTRTTLPTSSDPASIPSPHKRPNPAAHRADIQLWSPATLRFGTDAPIAHQPSLVTNTPWQAKP